MVEGHGTRMPAILNHIDSPSFNEDLELKTLASSIRFNRLLGIWTLNRRVSSQKHRSVCAMSNKHTIALGYCPGISCWFWGTSSSASRPRNIIFCSSSRVIVASYRRYILDKSICPSKLDSYCVCHRKLIVSDRFLWVIRAISRSVRKEPRLTIPLSLVTKPALTIIVRW